MVRHRSHTRSIPCYHDEPDQTHVLHQSGQPSHLHTYQEQHHEHYVRRELGCGHISTANDRVICHEHVWSRNYPL